MRGARIALLVWPEEAEGVGVERWRRVVGGAGRVEEVRGLIRPAVEGATAEGFDVIGVVGGLGRVAEVGAALARSGSAARLLAVPVSGGRALADELGMRGEGLEVLERWVELSRRGTGVLRRAPEHTTRRVLRVSMTDQPGALYGFTLGMGEWVSWRERLEAGVSREGVRQLAQAVAGGLLSRESSEAHAARLVVDGAAFSDRLRLTVVTTLRRLAPGVAPFGDAIIDAMRLNVLHGEVRSLVSAGAMAMLPGGLRRRGGEVRAVQASRVEVMLEEAVLLDGRRYGGEGSYSIGVRPGPLLPLLVV